MTPREADGRTISRPQAGAVHVRLRVWLRMRRTAPPFLGCGCGKGFAHLSFRSASPPRVLRSVDGTLRRPAEGGGGGSASTSPVVSCAAAAPGGGSGGAG